MTEQSAQLALLNEIARNYEQQGYTVFIDPPKRVLPSFMSDYHPDAVALKEGHNVAIEIKGGRSAATRRQIDHLSKLFDDKQDWKLSVFYTPSTATSESLPVVGQDLIAEYIGRARELAQTEQAGAALLILWAAFEATARSLRKGDFRKPQSPGRVVQVLAENGSITLEQERSLKPLISMRNLLIHGDLSQSVNVNDLEFFADLIERLPSQAKHSANWA